MKSIRRITRDAIISPSDIRYGKETCKGRKRHSLANHDLHELGRL